MEPRKLYAKARQTGSLKGRKEEENVMATVRDIKFFDGTPVPVRRDDEGQAVV